MIPFSQSKRFLDFSNAIAPWLGALAAILLGVGFSIGPWLRRRPITNRAQSVKIMFVHVPAAYMGIMIYAMMAASSLVVWSSAPARRCCGEIGRALGPDFTALRFSPVRSGDGRLWALLAMG